MKKVQLLKEFIHKEVTQLLNEAKKLKIEGITSEQCGIQRDEVGPFYIVLNPEKGSTLDQMVIPSDAVNFADKVKGGMAYDNIRAIMKNENKARRFGEKLLREREMQVKEVARKANEVKNLRDEVKNKATKLRQKATETQSAAKNIK
jgi:hypothetical protein